MSPLTRGVRLQLFRCLGPQLGNRLQRCLSSVPSLDLQFEDDVATITMRSGENRLNAQFLKQLDDLLTTVEQNKKCKGLITTGEGNFYSNGIDLEWAKSATADEVVDFVRNLNYLTRKFLMFPVPTMAVMNGHTFAGGLAIAGAHDIRTMNSDKGWMSFNEVSLKIPPTNSLVAMCRMKWGVPFTDMLVLGRRFTANEALHHNMIHAAFPKSSLMDESKLLFQGYLGKKGLPRGGVVIMKQHMYQTALDALKIDEAENFGPLSNRITQIVSSMP